jgi:hypothetical protein
MKRTVSLISSLLLFSTAFAKNRDWIDVEVTAITSNTSDRGTAAMPIGNATVNVPISVTFTYYLLTTKEMKYVLATRNKKILNITLHGHCKLALDGNKAYVLDDGGKEVKLELVRKELRTASPPDSSAPSQAK